MTTLSHGARGVARSARLCLLLGIAVMSSQAASANDWYVDGAKGSSNGKGTLAQPFLYVWQAGLAAKPGDTVHLLPTIVYPSIAIQSSGSSGKPITYTGSGIWPNLTRVSGGGSNFGFWINASYITVSNFDVTAPGPFAAIFATEHQHHLTITGNVAHDAGGSGIQTVSDDYVTITGNAVYGNAKDTSHAFNSGISTLWNLDVDSSTATKILIDSNTVYLNTNTPPCAPKGCVPTTATDSDGNGIIIDDSRRTQRDNIAYHGRILVSNNVVYGNGGRGIHIFSSDHITAIDNTVYFNNQDPYESSWRPGEITASYAGDVAIANNIVMSDGASGLATGEHVALSVSNCSGTAQVALQNNLGYDPQNDQALSFARLNSIPVVLSNNAWGNPVFVKPSLNPAVANFQVQSSSPALGTALASLSAASDALGQARLGAAPSKGAYQKAAASSVVVAH